MWHLSGRPFGTWGFWGFNPALKCRAIVIKSLRDTSRARHVVSGLWPESRPSLETTPGGQGTTRLTRLHGDFEGLEPVF
jgi:hypothetical protein